MYRPPQINVMQEFLPAPAQGAAPLLACLIGPKYALHRFGVASEQAILGAYDAVGGLSALWPNHVAGGLIEQSSAELYLKDTMLRYFGGTNTGYLTATDGNQVRSVGHSNLVFKTTTAAARDAAFGTRDVQIGDIVDASWNDGTLHTLRTKVAGTVAEAVPGTTAPVATRTTGFGDTSLAATAAACPSRLYCTYSAVGYDGLPAGFPLDTYRITVAKLVYGGVAGLDGTILNIVSAGGDSVQVTLGPGNTTGVSSSSSSNTGAGDGHYSFTPGTRGGTMTVALLASGELALGDTWTLTLSQAYTEAAVPTLTGTYDGLRNSQYIVTVLVGGLLGGATDVTLLVQTTNGADVATPITVAAGTSMPASYVIGTKGLTLVLAAVSYNAGDVFTAAVACATQGAVKTLLLQDPVTATSGTQVDIDLYVPVTQQVPVEYCTYSDTHATIAPLVELPSAMLGTPATYPVIEGSVYADYREYDTESANRLQTAGSLSDAALLCGPDSPKNPIGKAVRMALNAAAGQAVWFFVVATDDLAGYTTALDILSESSAPYGLVPLTSDEQVKDLFHASVIATSQNNQWRTAWLANDTPAVAPVYVARVGGAELDVTVAASAGTNYNRVSATSGMFQTNGVRAGDTIRINYSTLPLGDIVYDTYIVDRVLSETVLLLSTGLPAPASTPIKAEIWRNLNKSDYALALAAYPAKYDTRRVRAFWADGNVEADGTPSAMFYVAAVHAALRSGVAPHQPLSNTTSPGLYLDPVWQFGYNDLNLIAAGGNWLVVKDHTGRVYTRHQLTTLQNPDDIRQREDSMTTNLDEISITTLAMFQDVVGQSNISPVMLTQLDLRFSALIDNISNRAYPAFVGPQMLDAKLLKLVIDPVYKDSLDVEIDPDMPYPLNGLKITFKVRP